MAKRYTQQERAILNLLTSLGVSHETTQRAIDEHNDSVGKDRRDYPESSYKIVSRSLKGKKLEDISEYVIGKKAARRL